MADEDVKFVDMMNYPSSVVPEFREDGSGYKEFQFMAITTFKSVRRAAPADAPPKERVEVTDSLVKQKVADYIKKMDENKFEYVVLSSLKMWSYWWHHKLITDDSVDDIQRIVEQSNGRLLGGAGYNPLRIDESLRDVEKAVREYGFKYVYFHPITFGVAPNDRRCYPLYAKCSELGVPVGLQVGHSAEVLPSNIGHPMLVDDVAIEFPNLKINLSHTGWPWVAEWISMLWRHPNVYGDISAYFPASLDAEQIRFFNGSRGRDKVMVGTNGLDMGRYRQEFLGLGMRGNTAEMVGRTNALGFLGIE